MISLHQPQLFSSAVRAAISSRTDGDMKFGQRPDDEIVRNRELFLDKARIGLGETILVQLSYEKEDFTVYKQVDYEQLGEGMHHPGHIIADALVTTVPGIGLFLPLADCVGAILHDPVKDVLMVSHLGRHSLEQRGGTKSVQYLTTMYGSDPAVIRVWLSPAAGKAKYPLYAFDRRSMHEVLHEQLREAGILLENIETSPIDTTRSEEYYSHSEFLKGNRTEDGRFAIVAMMVEQGEPA